MDKLICYTSSGPIEFTITNQIGNVYYTGSIVPVFTHKTDLYRIGDTWLGAHHHRYSVLTKPQGLDSGVTLSSMLKQVYSQGVITNLTY